MMKEIMTKDGFYLFSPKVDYFFITNQVRKSANLLNKVQAKLQDIGVIYEIDKIDYFLEKAQYTMKESEKWGIVHFIKGKNFSAGDVDKNKHCELIFL